MHANERVAERARLLNERKGVEDYDDPAWTPIRGAEYAAELHYSLVVTPWFILRPNIQFLRQPGGVSEIKDGWVLGSQIIVKL